MSQQPGRTGEPNKAGEFGLIAWIRQHAEPQAQRSSHVVFGIGDDCAGLRFTPGREVLVTTDMLMDGRHFLTSQHTPEQIGRKAMAVNISDIAAMAGVPVAAVVAVALPKNLGKMSASELAHGLERGLESVAGQYGVALVGGDTNAWNGPLVINVTVLGETTDRGPVRRSGARAGDWIFVTGPLGGSLESGRHLEPRPRVPEALALHECVPLRAMIDISDGLAGDLGHILEESGHLGAVLEAAWIPIHEDALMIARSSGRNPLDHALHDGEDFELCFTVTPEDGARLKNRPPAGLELFQVGVITAEPGLRIRSEDGRIAPLEARGFDHLRAAGAGADS